MLGNLRSLASRVAYSALAALAALLVMWSGSEAILRPLLLLVVLLWIAIVLDLFIRPTIKSLESARWPLLLLAAIILVASVASLFWLRNEMSAWFVVYIVALVAAADIGAYFSGRRFGRRKLAVEISQGKTIEGAVGGIVAAFVLAVVSLKFISPGSSSFSAIFIFSIIAAFFSIAGDLFISRAKRTRGVKDSGNLLPGHGGVLDRFDGLLAAVPWMAFAILWT